MAPNATPPGPLHQLGAALSVPNFRRYVSGQALSLIGTWVETVAQGLLVLRLTHSGVLLGLTTATRYAPVLFLVNVARVLGPTIAAVVVDNVGIGWCFVINAISFLAVIASLLALDVASLQPTTPTPRAPGELRAGLHYAAGVPDIMRPLLMMAVIGTFAFEFEVSFPLLAHDTFHGGADAYGWLLGAFGMGAVAGGLYALGRARTGVARLGRVAVGYAAAMALLAISPTLGTAVGAAFLVGVATILFLTTGNSTIQLASNPHYRGRVMALWTVALVGSTPIGAPIIGAVSQAIDPRVAIGLGALACAGAAAIGWSGRSRPPDPSVTDLPASQATPSPPPASSARPPEKPRGPMVAAHHLLWAIHFGRR